MARTSWITLLAFLGFVGVTLLRVQDADFFVPTRQTQLPLVNVGIPTASFFIFAPILATALYVYLHIILLKLWDAIADIDAPEIDGQPLGESFVPWLLNDWALTKKGGDYVPPRPLRSLGNWASFLLVWAAGPAVLVGFWWRSMPAHDEWLTLLLGLCLLIALHAGVTSWRAALAAFASPRRDLTRSGTRSAGWIAVAVVVAAVSWLRTEGGLDHVANRVIDVADEAFGTTLFADCSVYAGDGSVIDGEVREDCQQAGERREPRDIRSDRIASAWFVPKLDWFELTSNHLLGRFFLSGYETWTPLAATNLVGVEIVDLPPDWRSPETARAAFRATWCAREGLSLAVCDHPPSSDRPPPVTLQAVRARWCSENGTVEVAACDKHFSRLDNRFELAWLEERDAAIANLPKLDLSGRDLRNADARRSALVNADLSGARLSRADLSEARLENADLQGALLEDASLWEARLERSNLSHANLGRANLLRARLEGAHLFRARLEGATLVEARLENADLHLAQLQGANLRDARLGQARLWGAGLEQADLTRARLEAADLMEARLDGANLTGARLDGALLSWASLRRTSLIGAQLEGTVLIYGDLREADLSGAIIGHSYAHGADLRANQALSADQASGMIGDDSTLLPATSNANEKLWSCWEFPSPGLYALLDRVAPFEDARVQLIAEWLCGPDNPRRKTGTPLALDAPYPDGHPLAGRD